MSDEPTIFDDPMVKAALNDGREPYDIAVLNCPECGALGYYNQGSHFTCRHCDASWYVCTEDEEPPVDRAYLRVDHLLTLEDVIQARAEEGEYDA